MSGTDRIALPNEDVDAPTGDDLVHRRRTIGLTQLEFAGKIGVPTMAVRAAEHEDGVLRPEYAAAIRDAVDDVTPVVLDSEAIRKIRDAYQLSQQELSRLTGVCDSLVGQWERGATPQPDRYMRLVSAVKNLGAIDENGDLALDTVERHRDPRIRMANTPTAVGPDLLADTIDAVQRFAENRPYAGSITAPSLHKAMMAGQEHTSQQVGYALARIARMPRPEKDGFRLSVTVEDRDAPDRYAIERITSDASESSETADQRTTGVSD
jgi:DNA-binding transcriptional regulator YiaG